MELTACHHALLFAYLARAVIEKCGSLGEAAVVAGVRAYGNQRGRRMALRAQQDGLPMDVRSYILYGEWQAAPGESDFHPVALEPEVELACTRCPWFNSWQQSGLLKYGQFYCRHLDAALADGFNGLELKVEQLMCEGAASCRMRFPHVSISPDQAAMLGVYQERLADRAKMDWEYHLGHLYAALQKAVVSGCGEDGRWAMEYGLEDFSAACGSEARDLVLAAANHDFTVLPPYDGL